MEKLALTTNCKLVGDVTPLYIHLYIQWYIYIECLLSFRYGNVLDFSRPNAKEDAPLNLNKSSAYQEPLRTASAKQHYLRQSRYLPGNVLNT